MRVCWLVWNIDPGAFRKISEDSVPEGAVQGINDSGVHSFDGSSPPYETHSYFFRLYALDVNLNLPSKARRGDMDRAMKGHIIEHAELTGGIKEDEEPANMKPEFNK